MKSASVSEKSGFCFWEVLLLFLGSLFFVSEKSVFCFWEVLLLFLGSLVFVVVGHAWVCGLQQTEKSCRRRFSVRTFSYSLAPWGLLPIRTFSYSLFVSHADGWEVYSSSDSFAAFSASMALICSRVRLKSSLSFCTLRFISSMSDEPFFDAALRNPRLFS